MIRLLIMELFTWAVRLGQCGGLNADHAAPDPATIRAKKRQGKHGTLGMGGYK